MASNIQTHRDGPLRKRLRRGLYAELAAILLFGLILHFCVWR